ncbi:MAG: bifunctional GTP diphosphokinase/guanosine-3',5'-bis(diphosphate) 3'-diphosphatase [Gammaproteobacteria bacterium 28-57-27]|nr:MAG: bifunctional GTP diphosphokinase/guanosine-3',5'-bis(diphosphate) 3'-diphosphatase [Gammaproteobacteria bacterium 28-57-27]
MSAEPLESAMSELSSPAAGIPSVPAAGDAIFAPLERLLVEYLDAPSTERIAQAYVFAAHAHEGQTRVSGEPYITHPVAVAGILAGLRMDEKTIIAALLHDVIEDTPTGHEYILAEYGAEVAHLVEGVSKLDQIRFKSKAEQQAANFRKMMMAMVEDVRVILIKLADRLHNMRTLGVMRPDKRRRIARETLEIYTPIANRLGLNSLRHELEALGFQAMYPMRYCVLEQALRKVRGNRREVMRTIEDAFNARLEDEGMQAEVQTREKRLYSIYRKMVQKHVSFEEVFDVFAVRIVTDSVDNVYRLLGLAHNLYKPLPGRFKDYIAIPKANGYQSLHTVLFGPHGIPLEVQIRTREMHQFAESGIAAHWLYKAKGDGTGATQARARDWLRELLDIQRQAGNPQEFLESVKGDLFPDEVYVFTPMGEIMELPRRSTPIDFAYAVHTDVGNSCVACKIDRQFAPLSSVLRNGQTIEIITAPGTAPSPNWLSFAVTAKARTHIRTFLKGLHADEAVQLGARLLDKALETHQIALADIDAERVMHCVQDQYQTTLNELLREIGLGNRMAALVALCLTAKMGEGEKGSRPGLNNAPLILRGSEGLVVSFAKCCHPIPGDPIIGFVSTGRGVVVHRRQCGNAVELASRPENLMPVEWASDVSGDYQAEIALNAKNLRGGLARMAGTIAETGADIDNVSFDDRDQNVTVITFLLRVSNRLQLAQIIRRLKRDQGVLKVWRT